MMDNELKIQVFETIFDELSAGISDAVVAMKSGQESTAEIGNTLAEMLALMDSRKEGKSLTELADAIKAIRINVAAPNVRIDVSPTPVTITPVVQIIERVQPGDYKLAVSYDDMDRITSATISRVK